MAAQATFGRDGAMFESLLGFVAQLSMVLWTLVILTAVIRYFGIRIYRARAARAAPAVTAAPTAAVTSTDAVFATAAASVGVTSGVSDTPGAQPRSREQVPAHAASTVEL